jgi:hypothetical protein
MVGATNPPLAEQDAERRVTARLSRFAESGAM